VIGNHLGERYEVTVLLQDGPIFTVYSAKDKVLGREVTVRVLKVPFSAEYRFVDVLQEIAKRAGSIKHPNVERMIEVNHDPATAYLVSEASRGSVLSDRIKKLAPYSVPVAVGMTISILDGMEAIHNSGYVHGDAGAHNIVVQADGTARVELPGIWEAYAASETAGSVMLPSMAPYLAPEVASGGMPTPASDTYAIGVILFQLLTGQYAYPGETPVAMAMRHATGAVPSARALNPAVPQSLDDLVRKSLAKDPHQRYPDASKMLSDLRRVEDSVRFGKTAAAPTRPTPVETPSASFDRPAEAKQTEPVVLSRQRVVEVKEREPRDVPVWMTIVLTFFLAVVVSLVAVWYFFTMNAPKTLVVPKIVGKSSSDAKDILARMNIEMRIAGEEPSETAPKDTVIDVDPAVGQQVREGGTVQVKVSSGSRLVSLPDLRGKSPDEARDILKQFNLDLDRTDPIDDPKVAKGMIVRQNPPAKTRVEQYTRVNVWVSTGPLEDQTATATQPNLGPPNNPTPPVNVNTKYLYTVRIKLTKITDPVVLKVDITDANGTRQIYEAQHYPNEEVTIRTEGYGEHAVFRIYYNGQFVTQVTKEADSNAQGGTTGTDNGDNANSQDNGAGQ